MAHFVPAGACFDRPDDLARRAPHVGRVENLHRAFRMHQNLDARIFFAELRDMRRA